jgi:hypothetical protein
MEYEKLDLSLSYFLRSYEIKITDRGYYVPAKLTGHPDRRTPEESSDPEYKIFLVSRSHRTMRQVDDINSEESQRIERDVCAYIKESSDE